MSLLLDAFGPTDVGAYTLLSRSLSASSTLAGSTATALATADDAGPMCCTTCTSHRGPVPAAKGRDGAVLGVEMPAAVGSASPLATSHGSRFLPLPGVGSAVAVELALLAAPWTWPWYEVAVGADWASAPATPAHRCRGAPNAGSGRDGPVPMRGGGCGSSGSRCCPDAIRHAG